MSSERFFLAIHPQVPLSVALPLAWFDLTSQYLSLPDTYNIYSFVDNLLSVFVDKNVSKVFAIFTLHIHCLRLCPHLVYNKLNGHRTNDPGNGDHKIDLAGVVRIKNDVGKA